MGNKEKNFVSAVVYVHNAQDRLEGFLRMILREFEKNFEHSEIICVNDGSDDDSKQQIKKVAGESTFCNITILNLSYFHGLEVAMNAGMDLAIGDFVFEFDTTYQDYSQDMIMKVYRRSLEGYDIVSASPAGKEKLSSRIFYKVFDRFTELKYQMNTESFRILSRRVINRISSMNKTNPYRKAMYASSGLKTDHLKYEIIKFTEQPEMDYREKAYRKRLAMDSLLLFTQVGYRFSMVMTFCMMAISVGVILYSLITYRMENPVEGWTTTIIFLSVAFFALFGILTVIIKYLQLLVDLVFRRKQYSFESIEKLTK